MGAQAKITGAGRLAIGVEASILVQWNQMRRVGGTEDVATVTAVVATKENPERRATGRRIAVGRGRVGLKSG